MPSAIPTDQLVTLPETRRAIVQGAGGDLAIDANVPLPALSPTMVLVKTAAVALNPTDYKMHTNFPSPGACVGCDFAGTVVAMGSEASTVSSLQIGDRVCSAVHGSNPIDHQSGAFSEYVAAEAELVLKVPRSMSWEKAAALGGIGHGTICLAFWQSLGLPGTPEQPVEGGKPVYVLVYGGSTSTGTMAIQILKLCGLTPIATCSPRNFALVKSFGAAAAFDYNLPNCAESIRAYTKNTLRYVLDCITDLESVPLCYAAIGRAGGRYTCLEMCPENLQTRRAVKADFVMGYELWGKRVALERGYGREANPAGRAMGLKWFRSMQALLDQRKIQSHPVRVVPGGFQGIIKGLTTLKKGGISGEKMVVFIE